MVEAVRAGRCLQVARAAVALARPVRRATVPPMEPGGRAGR